MEKPCFIVAIATENKTILPEQNKDEEEQAESQQCRLSSEYFLL